MYFLLIVNNSGDKRKSRRLSGIWPVTAKKQHQSANGGQASNKRTDSACTLDGKNVKACTSIFSHILHVWMAKSRALNVNVKNNQTLFMLLSCLRDTTCTHQTHLPYFRTADVVDKFAPTSGFLNNILSLVFTLDISDSPQSLSSAFACKLYI